MRLIGTPFTPASFVGGHAVLDFLNTAAGRAEDPRDWLGSYARLLEWADAAGVAAGEELDAATALAGADEMAAAAALGRAVALRESLWRVFSAKADGHVPAGADLEAVRAAWAAAADRGRFIAGDGLGPAWTPETAGLDWLRYRLADAAVELMRHADWGRLKQCDGENCGWLFLDTSKAGRRRWCDMATCGNTAKARRHYHRSRGQAKA